MNKNKRQKRKNINTLHGKVTSKTETLKVMDYKYMTLFLKLQINIF